MKINRAIQNAYYLIKDFLFPWNRITLKKLPRSWSDVHVRLEEVVFQLLDDFYNGEQPFHLSSNTPYEKSPSVDRHRELLLKCKENFTQEEFRIEEQLLDILEWYRSGGLNDEDSEWEAMLSILLSEQPNGTDLMFDPFTERNLITENMMFVIKHRHRLWT